MIRVDQIVRTDLKTLVDEDLLGAPYGYAPMGDDRAEMEGFRFWKQGYWREVLRGRPYHIRSVANALVVGPFACQFGDILDLTLDSLSLSSFPTELACTWLIALFDWPLPVRFMSLT